MKTLHIEPQWPTRHIKQGDNDADAHKAQNDPLGVGGRIKTLHIEPQRPTRRRRRQVDEALITPSSGMTRLPMLGVLLICLIPPAVMVSTTSPAMDTGRCFLLLFKFASTSGSALCCQQVTWPGVFIVRPSPEIYNPFQLQ